MEQVAWSVEQWVWSVYQGAWSVDQWVWSTELGPIPRHLSAGSDLIGQLLLHPSCEKTVQHTQCRNNSVCIYFTTCIHIHVHVLEGRKKKARSYKQTTRQSNTAHVRVHIVVPRL